MNPPPLRERCEAALLRAWRTRGALATALLPLALLYAAATALRRALYAVGLKKVERLPVPVIVVGNIFLGGTGKTPLAIWLVDALRKGGYTPGVISRGYRGTASTPQLAHAAAPAEEVGDEPLLIATRSGAPVMVGRRRVDAARALLEAHPEVDVIVADDGLQHYALGRDIEIVLFDARGVGNGWPLPAGPLREPATRRRDFTVLNVGSDGAAMQMPAFAGPAARMQLLGDHAERLAERGDRVALADLKERAGARGIAAVAGIGNPARFFATLAAAGVDCRCTALPDHYDFTRNPFATLDAGLILITEKDAVKCQAIASIRNDPRIWVVPVTARIDGALAEHILEKLREPSSA